MLVCACLPGRQGKYVKKEQEPCDSYKNFSGDIMVMPVASQVLPIYLVRYWGITSKAPKQDV